MKVKAAATRAITAPAACGELAAVAPLELEEIPFALPPIAVLVLWDVLELELPEPESGVKALEDEEELGVATELGELEEDDDVELPTEPTSEPVPQGIWSPLGCAEFEGGVVVPEAEAMANRVVQ